MSSSEKKHLVEIHDPLPDKRVHSASRQQVVYGETTQWITILSACIGMISPALMLAWPEKNVISPNQVFASIWRGENLETIWSVSGGEFPGGHFYLRNFFSGDGFAQFGIVLGCSVALWALIPTAYFYIKDREFLYASLSFFVMLLIASAMLGVGMG